MKKDEPPPESYLIDFANAYRIYKDVDIARDKIRKPKEEKDDSEQGRTSEE